MSEQMNPDPTQDTSTPDENLMGEFRAIARNMANILRAAWERPERQKLQQEIENGLTEVSNVLRKEAKNIAESPVSQKIKSEVEDMSERVRSGQVETKVREELISALHLINTELVKVSEILSGESEKAEEHSPAGDAPEDANIEQETTSQSGSSDDGSTTITMRPEDSVPTDQEEQ